MFSADILAFCEYLATAQLVLRFTGDPDRTDKFVTKKTLRVECFFIIEL